MPPVPDSVPPPAIPPAATAAPRPLVLVTGLSGAGMSTALKALEDLGYEVLDNLPLRLVDAVLAQEDSLAAPLALGIDMRTRGFDAERLDTLMAELAVRPGVAARLVFLTASDEALQRRFTETRRRHPLAADRPVADGILQERTALEPVEERADLRLDTTDLAAHELRRILAGHFGLSPGAAPHVQVCSFSFRHGVPREADLVFDVRFLRNPHYDPALRPLTGLDPEVQAHIADDSAYGDFMERLLALLLPLLPRYGQEGKSYLTVAIGCTGGKHRSVFIAELLAARLAEAGWPTGRAHRELERRRAG